MRHLTFFFRLFVWFNLRNMRNRLGRALTVLLGIALGASVFTSVRLSIHASLNTFSKSMELIAGGADQVLVRPGGGVPEELISRLLTHPSIHSASPFFSTYVRPAIEGADPFLLIGFDPLLDRSFRNWQIAETGGQDPRLWLNLIKDPYTLIVAEPLARRYGWVRGELLNLEHSKQTVEFRMLGTLRPEGLALAEGGQIALTDIATFQEFTGLYGLVDRIDMRLKPFSNPRALEEIRKILPESIMMTSPSAAKESGQGMVRAYQLNLSILSFASLFVGMFLVYSLVALNAASRRHELAILRSTGASSYLIFAVFLAEGALLGIAGWIAAIPISSFLVKYLLHGVNQTISTLFVRVQVDKLSLNLWEVILSFGVTVFISILAAFQPAREAMQVAPKEALEISQHEVRHQRSPRKLGLIGLICIFLVLPLSQLPGLLNMPLPGYMAILMLFVGFSLLSPWILERMGHGISPVLRRFAGIPAYLAGRYVRDSGTRTAVSVGALITAVALFGSLVIMIHSFRKTVELWVHQSIRGDLFLTNKMGEINQFRFPIPSEIVDGLQRYSDRADIVPNRRFFLYYGDFPYEFEVLDLKLFFKHAEFFWMKGDPEEIRPKLIRGEGVLISEVFSNRTGITEGDQFQARIEDSVVKLPVLGVIRDYRTQGGVVFYSFSHFKERYHDPRWGALRFFFRDRTQDLDAAVSELRSDIIKRWGENFSMISGKHLRQSILRVFDETFAVTTVLLLIALVIAALGITTTLTVLVLERSRQLNTLFAVGASFRQIRAMILWEAAFMVVAGELAGIICGFILSHILVYVINRQSFGWTFLYGVDWVALGMSLPLIILTALAAALPAIKLVFREPPATLLRE
ncbi:MAG: ABC transporter permease [Desulfobacterales bacterium]|nr:MAG: ABC transporter permease [Desulfobacterales bacterium]